MQALQKTMLDNPQVTLTNNTVDTYSIKWKLSIDNDSSNTTVRHITDISSSNRLEIYNIKNYLTLEPNWDSYGAAAIPEQSIRKAIDFINEIDKYSINVYTSSPGPNGEILVHLSRKLSGLSKREIEFLFYPDKSKFVLFESNEYQSQGPYTLEILNELIEWLRNDA